MPRDEVLRGIHRRLDDEKFKLQRAGSLLKILAEHCQENRHRDQEEAWFEAEYLADRIGEHVAALGKVSEEVDLFSGAMYRAAHGIEPPPRRAQLKVVPTDGDAA
jgi:hypothetical protein